MIVLVEVDKDIKNLNKYLEGIYMAINTFEHYVSMAKEEKNLSLLKDIELQFKSSAVDIINRIIDLGGKSKDEASLIGKVSETFINIKDKIMVQNDDQLLTEAYKYIETGLKMGNKFLNENHIQGKTNSMIRLGLFYNNFLVSVMTFKLNKNHLLNFLANSIFFGCTNIIILS